MCVWCVYVCSEHGPNLYILVRDVPQSVNFGQFMDCPGRSMDPCLEQAIHGLPTVPSPTILGLSRPSMDCPLKAGIILCHGQSMDCPTSHFEHDRYT